MEPMKSLPARICFSPDRLEIFVNGLDGKCLADIVVIQKNQLKLSYVIISDDGEGEGGSLLPDLYKDIKESK